MTSSSEYDVIVLGGGPAGENAASYAIAGSDRTAVIVEHELVGGECSYWACMPSKALLRPVEARLDLQRLPGAGEGSSLDLPKVLDRRDGFTSHLDDAGQVSWAESNGIDVVRGKGRLAGVRTVVVIGPDGQQRTLRARHAVVVATGTRAQIPPVNGLAEALPWTSRDATNLHEIPRRVVVIGGGVVACEAATWLRELGAEQVTMLVRGDRLLASAEPFAGELVSERLRKAGVDIRFGTEADAVSRAEPSDTGPGNLHGGEVTVTIVDERLTADEIVVAAGRAPATDDLGLDAVGLDAGRSVATDDHLCVEGVDGRWLYAVGDVNGRSPLTHMGKYQARVCGDVIAAHAEGRSLDGERYAATADHHQVPQVVFTDPQVGSVGYTEEQARRDSIGCETVEFDLGSVAGAVLHADGYQGRAKLVIDPKAETVIGATFVGAGVAELVHSATIAVVGEVPLERLWHAVPSYPTISEVWLRLLESRR